MAIQISGTEVISNSRGLNNIASVDATTAASITAAGVGGGGTFEKLSTTTISSSTGVVYTNLSVDTHNRFQVHLSGIESANSSTKLSMRLVSGPDSNGWYNNYNIYGSEAAIFQMGQSATVIDNDSQVGMIWLLHEDMELGRTTPYSADLIINVYGVGSASSLYPRAHWFGKVNNDTIAGHWYNTNSVAGTPSGKQAFAFSASGGTMDKGTFTLYGVND